MPGTRPILQVKRAMGRGASRQKTKPITGLRTTTRNREVVIAVPRMNSLTLKFLTASKGSPSSRCR